MTSITSNSSPKGKPKDIAVPQIPCTPHSSNRSRPSDRHLECGEHHRSGYLRETPLQPHFIKPSPPPQPRPNHELYESFWDFKFALCTSNYLEDADHIQSGDAHRTPDYHQFNSDACPSIDSITSRIYQRWRNQDNKLLKPLFVAFFPWIPFCLAT